MKEYIEREEIALKVKRNLMPNVDVDGTVSVENAERYFLNLLAEQPVADVVEVVRCENCKLRDTEGCPFAYYSEYEGFVDPTKDDDFCSYGERR